MARTKQTPRRLTAARLVERKYGMRTKAGGATQVSMYPPCLEALVLNLPYQLLVQGIALEIICPSALTQAHTDALFALEAAHSLYLVQLMDKDH